VTLSWDTVGASQVLLDEELVEGTSTVVLVTEETTFTLEATGSPWPVFAGTTVHVIDISAQISPPSGRSVEVTFNANPGTYTVNWSVFWEGGEIAGTETNSMQVTTDGGPQSVVWENVPIEDPMGQIITVTCTITGFPYGPFNLQWPAS
jgi:hypothetical protein